MASSDPSHGSLTALWKNPAPLASLPGEEALRGLFWKPSDTWQEQHIREYFSSRPRLHELGAHLCEPLLLKILGVDPVAEEDAVTDEETNYDDVDDKDDARILCHLGRSALHRDKNDKGRSFWISRRDLLLNPEHALKLELFEASQRSPRLKGQRKKAAVMPAPLERRKTAEAGQPGS